LAACCASCASWRYEATDGSESAGSWLFPGGEGATSAVQRSAQHDIPCSDVTVVDEVNPGTDRGVYIAEGCGQRMAYAFVSVPRDTAHDRCVLISRMPLQSR
jgi:hypothetical protein